MHDVYVLTVSLGVYKPESWAHLHLLSSIKYYYTTRSLHYYKFTFTIHGSTFDLRGLTDAMRSKLNWLIIYNLGNMLYLDGYSFDTPPPSPPTLQ